jgi:hypothetical protein
MLGTVHISTVTVRSFTLWPEENRAGTKARYGVAFVCTGPRTHTGSTQC